MGGYIKASNGGVHSGLNYSFKTLLLGHVVSISVLTRFLRFHRHFDKDKTGYLDHQEFKSCLRSLGYDLSIVEEGEEDPEFEAILRTVDPNG